MNAKSFIAAAAVFVCAATAFAAESPAPATSAATASATESATEIATTSASNLNLPTLGAPSHTPRAEARAEAVDFVKNYKTTLSVQLDQYKN